MLDDKASALIQPSQPLQLVAEAGEAQLTQDIIRLAGGLAAAELLGPQDASGVAAVASPITALGG